MESEDESTRKCMRNRVLNKTNPLPYSLLFLAHPT